MICLQSAAVFWPAENADRKLSSHWLCPPEGRGSSEEGTVTLIHSRVG